MMSQKNLPPPFSTRLHGVTSQKTQFFIHKHVLQIYYKITYTPTIPVCLSADHADMKVALFGDEDTPNWWFVTLVGLAPNSFLCPVIQLKALNIRANPTREVPNTLGTHKLAHLLGYGGTPHRRLPSHSQRTVTLPLQGYGVGKPIQTKAISVISLNFCTNF